MEFVFIMVTVKWHFAINLACTGFVFIANIDRMQTCRVQITVYKIHTNIATDDN